MKIIELRAQNVKKLRAVRIRPDGSLIQITGKNGAGKTSVLDAIAMALGGKALIPSKPIREGEQRAAIEVDLGEYVISRTWTDNETTYLTVKTKDGAKYPSPQALLDRLVGSISFDPLAFARMDAKAQGAALRQVVGLDFSSVDQRRKVAFEDRQVLNRTVKALEARLAAMPMVEAPDVPVKVSELLVEQAEAMAAQKANDAQREELDRLTNELSSLNAQVEELHRQIAEKQRAAEDLAVDVLERQQVVDALVDPDLAAVNARIQSAESINEGVRNKQERARVASELASYREQADRMTAAIAEFDGEKAKQLATAEFPIVGLSVSDAGMVVFNGIPFAQLSSAEQLKVSVAMGLAMNPTIRVILIRDGSLLDASNLAVIAEMADKSDSQIWVERVTEGQDVGVVIEDGEVKPAVAIHG